MIRKLINKFKALSKRKKALAIIISVLCVLVLSLVSVVSYQNIANAIIKKKCEHALYCYIQAHVDKDVELLAQAFYEPGSKEYEELIFYNPDYFEIRELKIDYSTLEIIHKHDSTFRRYIDKAAYKEYLFSYKTYDSNRYITNVLLIHYENTSGYWALKHDLPLEEDYNYNFQAQHLNAPRLRIEDESATTITIEKKHNIDQETFSECNKLAILNIPATYSQIDPSWFYFTENLMSVNIHPDSKQLKSVDGVVYNKDMTELIYFPRGKIQIEGQENSVFEIPDTVVKICDNAFLYNNSLRKVIIPSSVKTIGESAFEESKYIKEIVFSEGLSTIKSNAFSKCQALESVSLPSTLKYIGNNVFKDCTSLQSFSIPTHTQLNYLGYAAFDSCIELTTITLPNSLKKIENWTFQNCFSLKNFTLSKNLEYIGLFAFRNCVSLKELDLSDIKYVDRGAFYSCNELKLNYSSDEKWNPLWNWGYISPN